MAGRERLNKFLFALFGFEKAKSKSHILLIIFIHTTGWCLLFFLPVLLYPVRINEGRFIVRELIDKSVLVGLFYLNYYFLIPRFFERRKYVAYSSLIGLSFIFYLAQHVVIRTNFFPRREGPFQFVQIQNSLPDDTLPASKNFTLAYLAPPDRANETPDTIHARHRPFFTNINFGDDSMRGLPHPPMAEPELFGIPRGAWLMLLNNTISSFALLLLLGGFIRLAFSFIRNQNEKRALENAKLNAEVNFLKSQINPHFLFNTLNSIYSQAHAKSANTESSILKLSELLRYMLYDSGENKVELSRDIQYIHNYIDLQKMRLSSKIRINYSVEGKLEGYVIAPMLLITFIENAFKHGISYTQASVINIQIRVFEETLTLFISNPNLQQNSFAKGGIGLKNVTRRLDLLYPGKYHLEIKDDDLLHIVNLKLDLKSD
jgi:hypothetical protein